MFRGEKARFGAFDFSMPLRAKEKDIPIENFATRIETVGPKTVM